ncbi:MAG: adenylate/guanylate cyclase domain-containing protein, partial [Pseudomonadota bacterium]
YDRWWLKYAVYGADILAICATFVIIPVSRGDDVPQIITFRAYGIYFLFPLVAMAALSLSWRLVLWAGTVAVIGWWAAFALVVLGMENTLSWGDMPPDATRADYEAIFLSIDFIGRGNRIEETGMLMLGTVALAIAVYRARRVFFAQVAAALARDQEAEARARVTDLLGRYVPEEVAERLISDPTPLAPQVRHGTALILDIADFTRFAADKEPVEVIASLDQLLADASDRIAAAGGVVINYLGDGLLATFNTPVAVDRPEVCAVTAARALLNLGETSGFGLRIGIASGEIASGNVGSSRRQSFTVYGTTVNLAARLEAQAKALGKSLVIDTTTSAALPEGMKLLPAGKVEVRGLERPISIFVA